MVLPHKPIHYLYLSIILFIIGMLFYGMYNEMIIIRLPFKRIGTAVQHDESQRKSVKLTYWNGEAFTIDDKELLFSKNTLRTLHDLIATWLIIQEEEHFMPKKVALQSVMLDASGTEAFISFDRNPLPKEKSINQKLLWIEGLLKTIKDSTLAILKVRLLASVKPLHDAHLDFTHSWPIAGYTNPQP